MIKGTVLLTLLALTTLPMAVPAFPVATSYIAETRCGWFVNPTPANAWLIDADREWLIGSQGGYQADGDWPDFKPSQWVKTNGYYGYGCACMKVSVNKADDKIVEIFSSNARPLSACRKDKAIKSKEPNR
ncbi:MAG: DUF4087 domain-containing protein [Pyrinomonadaceae bacterium]